MTKNAGELVLRRLEDHLCKNQESSFRRHLGASIIGHKCARQVWFKFRWAKEVRHEARMLRLFQRGHLEEPRFESYLKAIGATVWTTDVDGKQFRVTDAGGHFGGSCDGVAINVPGLPPEAVLLEMKTHGDKSFQKLKKEGLAKSKPEHMKQAQVYMRGLNLNACLYMAVNKNDDDLFLFYFKRDVEQGEQLAHRAKSIVFTEQAPARISETPSWFECMWCDFKNVCFGAEMPHVNCRTCAHSTPEPDGTWSCRLSCNAISAMPEKGCDLHIYNPTFFPHATVSGMDLEANSIAYQTRNKGTVVNGKYATASSKLDLTC